MSSSNVRARPGTSSPSNGEEDILSMDDVQAEAKSLIDKVIKDVGKSSASKQLIIGGASGWMTGYLMMKVGKIAALAVGGGIILLQVANHNGYIKINWDKVFRQAEEVGGRIEQQTSSRGPKFLDKVERFVDRKLDKAETVLKKKERKAKKWFHRAVLDEDEPFLFEEIHVFLASFMAGFAMGIAMGLIVR